MNLDTAELQEVISNLEQKGYIMEKELGKGGYAIVYRMTKDNIPYAIRISKLSSDEELNEEQLKKLKTRQLDIINATTLKKCKFDILKTFCKKECISENIACTKDHFLTLNDYLIQIMKAYDSDLEKFIVKKEAYIQDIRKYSEMSVKDIKSLNNFISIIKVMWDAIQLLHSNDMAHGDIKPENFLVNISGDTITDVALADLDTLCLIKDKSKPLCASVATTPLYATTALKELVNNEKEPLIQIVKKSDLFGFSITIFQLWFGYMGFINFFDEIFQKFKDFNTFTTRFGRLFDNDNKDNRNKIIDKLKLEKKKSFDLILQKYPNNSNEITNAIRILDNAINLFETIIDNKPVPIVQFGGYSNVDYKKKYLKYKSKYIALKKQYN